MSSDDPLAEALQKIKWADKRIKKVGVLAHNYLREGAFEIIIQCDTEAGKKHAQLRFLADIPDDLIDETHAALGNYRGSLDSVAWAVANRLGPPKVPTNVSFPVGESQEAFESTGTQGKIEQVGADWATFVKTLKPYRGGNDLLYDLHAFNNADKHRVLMRIGLQSNLASFSASATLGKQISFNMSMFGFALEDGANLVTVSELDPDPNIQLAVGIGFCETGPDKPRGKPLIPMLHQFSHLCKNIVEGARRALF